MATELTKLTGAKAKVLFECPAKSSMSIIAGSQRDLCNVHCAHPQFSPCAFQAHTPDIAGDVLACMGSEDAMKVGHRETSDCRQHLPIERFVSVLGDVLLDAVMRTP
jgi:hypothetical protein